MTNLVQQIKKRLTILDVVKGHVLYLKPTKPDGWYVARCPFHQPESDPRGKRKFWIDARPGRGLCSCFVPKCAALNPGFKPMDAINFYARMHQISNRQAIFELADILGLMPDLLEEKE